MAAEEMELKVVRRGAAPLGGGEVALRMPVVKQLEVRRGILRCLRMRMPVVEQLEVRRDECLLDVNDLTVL